MAFRHVLIYSTEGNPLGYAIKEDGAIKLQSTNIWSEGEEEKLNEQLNRLNENVELHTAWPDAKDPDVVAILANPEFMPIEMHMAEVVDDDDSYYVYTQEPELDLDGQPTGETIQGHLDEVASVIVTKKMMVPVRPSDVMERTKAACELVARSRTGLTK